MKSVNNAVVLGLVLSAGFNFYQIGITNALRIEEKHLNSENRLLKDQVNDLSTQILTGRTYEEGLTDGLMRSKNIGYVDGYHSAMAQVTEERYMLEESRKEAEALEKARQEAVPAVNVEATE